MTHIEDESQDSEKRRPVLDLEAEDVSPPADKNDTASPDDTQSLDEAADASSNEPSQEETALPPPPPPRQKPPFWTKSRVAGVAAVVAAILGAWAYREFGAQWWPPSAMSVMEAKISTLEAGNRTLNEQLIALGSSFDSFKADVVNIADEQTKKAADLETKIAGLDKGLGELRQTLSTLGTGATGTADPAALAEVTRRIEQLEQQVSALRDGGTPAPTTGNEDFTELTQALADLKAKFQAGVPFKSELDRVAVYVPGNADLAELEPHAAAGIANPQALGSALEALVPGLASSGGEQPAAAEASGFWTWVGTVVKVRDLNTLDWGDLAHSAASDAAAGDLKAAIAKLEEPGGDLPAELAKWRDQARQRLDAEAAMAQLAAAVTQVIMGKP